MATEEDHVGLLAIIAKIREASGLGAKPMLTELPAAIAGIVAERDEAIVGSNALLAAQGAIVHEVWELLGGQDATRADGQNLVSRVRETVARATAAEARVAQLETDLAASREERERMATTAVIAVGNLSDQVAQLETALKIAEAVLRNADPFETTDDGRIPLHSPFTAAAELRKLLEPTP